MNETVIEILGVMALGLLAYALTVLTFTVF
jgi:hypothetical protein